ncbi:hypothetical protein C4J87_3411 [Pseudomonas sp. R1-43-08]|nr:hypothetical protein C4J87_3411 [Pseudomonas sp. R1-43-08]
MIEAGRIPQTHHFPTYTQSGAIGTLAERRVKRLPSITVRLDGAVMAAAKKITQFL